MEDEEITKQVIIGVEVSPFSYGTWYSMNVSAPKSVDGTKL